MKDNEIKNAIITSAILDIGDRGGSGQGFGGYALYLPKSYKHHEKNSGYAGHFIFRSMEIAGVESWDKMKGNTLRVKIENGIIVAIGHIVKDDWFEPRKDFKTQE